MKLLRFVLSFVMYVCVYLFFFALTLLTFKNHANNGKISQSIAFIAVLFPLVFPFVIWWTRKRLREKLSTARVFLEKAEIYGPLLRFLSGYLFGYLGMNFLINSWSEIKNEYSWTVWFLWQGFSFLLGLLWARLGSADNDSDKQRVTFPWNERKVSEKRKNLEAIRHLSYLTERSDHPFDLLEARLPYPDKLEPDDLSPLYKSAMQRSMELGEVPPESVQRKFKDMLGIVCAHGEKFLFVYRFQKISILENRQTSTAQSFGVGIPGPLGIGFGTGTSQFSSKEGLRASKYGSGLVALTTKNLYFQRNGMWQKVRRNRVVSCEEDLGDLYITISEPSGISKQIQLKFFDFEVSKMLETLLKS